MMYDMSADSFPAKIDSESKKKQWPIVKNDSINLVLEIGQVYNRGSERSLFLLLSLFDEI